MGLRETFQNAAVSVFAAADNLVESVTYLRVLSNPVHDPITGAVTTDDETFSIALLFNTFTAEDVQGVYKKAKDFSGENILPTDVMASQAELNFKNAARVLVEPNVDDIVTRASGEIYRVVAFKKDSASAVFRIFLRRRS